jgi:Flp pilus assembly protein TadD
MSTSAYLLSGQSGGEIAGAVVWSISPQDGAGAHLSVPFFIDIDGTTLLAEGGSRLAIGIYAYVLSGQSVAASYSQGLIVEDEQMLAVLRATGLRFGGRFELAPGSYSLRLMVRNHDSQRLFLTRAELVVPDPDSGQTTLLPPLFADPSGSWLRAREQKLGEQAAFSVAAGVMHPAPQPVLLSGRSTPFVLPISGPWPTAGVTASLIDLRGRTAAEPELTLAEPGGAAAGTGTGIAFYQATLAAVDLAPGLYHLVLDVKDQEAAASGCSLRVVVAPAGSSQVWAALDNPESDQPVEQLAAPVEITLDTADNVPPLPEGTDPATEYRRALQLLVAGDEVACRKAVADLERAVCAHQGPPGLDDLRTIEKKEAIKLGNQAPGSLLPIVTLHRELFRFYSTGMNDLLTYHACELTADLAEVAGSKEIAIPEQPIASSQLFAKGVLMSLAGDLLDVLSVGPATELLERVLELDPESPQALLALGAIHERLSRYDEAVARLQQLLEVEPDNPEGQLRLAINLTRTNREQRSEELLRGLIADHRNDWVTSVAYQELSRLLVARGRLREAASVLREGVGKLPESQRLRIKLAYVLDRIGRPWEAGDLVDQLQPDSGSSSTSPRARYTFWPALSLGEGESDILAAARSQVVVLGQALLATDTRSGKEAP